VTRGLGLLADEAVAAPVDVGAVVAAAAVRTRNRAVLTTALVTIALVGALVMTLGAVKPDPVPVATTPPTTSTYTREYSSPEEQAVRATRLQADVIGAFDRILPSGWRHSTYDWGCESSHCWAEGDVIDDVGPIEVSFVAWGRDEEVSCYDVPNCTTKVLDDDTFVAVTEGETGTHATEARIRLSISALRPDGGAIGIVASWPKDRPAPALTDEQWLEFAKAFSY